MSLGAFLAFFQGPFLFAPCYLLFPPTALFCNDLMEELELNPATRIMWKSVKPLLVGQVLYAPDSPAVRRIIKNVSHMPKRFHGPLAQDCGLQDFLFLSDFLWWKWACSMKQSPPPSGRCRYVLVRPAGVGWWGGSNHGWLGCKRRSELIGCGGYHTVDWRHSCCNIM